MTDYERIALVIRYIDQHVAEQPDLAKLAAVAGLSRFHFHRLFSEWAGVTPKDFLQCLSLAHARSLLRRGESVLNTAADVGLSGPGRLHDLCVQLDAASPGELKSGGEGWSITFGFADTPFGTAIIGESPRGVCHLSFDHDRNDAVALLRNEWPNTKLSRDDQSANNLASRIFRPSPEFALGRPLRAFVRGTEFQVRVWRSLLQIRPGSIRSYQQLAEKIGSRAGARAVGNAVAKNPLAFLIPCHRVIRQTGVVGEYRWGRARKRAMLAWEGSG